MAYCSNCGAELPENGKFCASCGAQIPTQTENVVSGIEQQTETDDKKVQCKMGTISGIAAFALAIIGFFGDPPILTIAVSIASIVLGVFAFVKKGRIKVFAIIAFIIAAFNLTVTFIFVAPSDYFSMPKTEIVQGKGDATNAESEKTKKYNAFSEETGVNSDLKEFLDSYEAFVDEYVEFLNEYKNDPNNVSSMLNEYLDMLTRMEEFSEKVDQYDTDSMTTADEKYYLEVVGRCQTKILNAAGNMG